MSRLPRPHIPLEVRCRVALRQLGRIGEAMERSIILNDYRSGGPGLKWYLEDTLLPMLRERLGAASLHLDHDPALENRKQIHSANATVLSNETIIGYFPDANDPRYLIYREGGFSGSNHDVKTRIRGEHGQLSDHGLARKEKRRQRKLTKPKTKWPKGRKLQSRNTFRRSK